MMAIMLVPLLLFVGSAVDVSRVYTVKARLQQACDAGVLAGRRTMTGIGATLDDYAKSQANAFFNNNFHLGWMQTASVPITGQPTGTVFVPAKTTESQVSGTATLKVPMALMRVFGFQPVTLTATCEARYDVADSDIMFVLDTTGSMACTTADDTGSGCGAQVASYQNNGTTAYYNVEESGSKMAGLRSAVLSFYDTLAAAVDPGTHIRYGFVTYTSTVNAGLAVTNLSSSYMVPKWQYDTRHIVGDYNNGSRYTVGNYSTDRATCSAYDSLRSPASGFGTDGTAKMYYTSYSYGTCTLRAQNLTPMWRYQLWPLDVSQYVATINTSNTVDDPSKVTAATSRWQGCIEERPTTASSSFSTTNLPPDLDPDLTPTASVDANGIPTSSDTRWRPMWPDVVYLRGNNMNYVDDAGDASSAPYGDASYYQARANASGLSSGYVTCGKPVQRLTTMSRSDVSNYVNASDFKAIGGTYHDTGMIWGTRMISPNGIFAADTQAWTGRNTPNRYIVFMTDGYMAPNYNIYGMYGIEYYDQRVTGGSLSSDTDYHNARFLTECAAAKARNITVFVVSFGQALNSQLTQCASPGKAYSATDNAGLTTAFRSIAGQVAMLRVSK